MRRFRLLTSHLILAFVIFGVSDVQGAVEQPRRLDVGSKAPEIDVEHWFSDNDGAFKPVTEIETGKVYVIEFWATWCGPCVSSMPHLAELQAKYADKNVQVISVSDEDPDTVEAFLKRNVRGEDTKRTYADLTSTYCLTADPDRSVHEDYLEASGQEGIPTAFVVGRDGFIEWIGHPLEMDQPLEQVVNGTWDRVRYLSVKKKTAELFKKMALLLDGGEVDGVIELLGEALKDADLAAANPEIENVRIKLMVEVEHPKTAGAIEAFIEKQKDDALRLDGMAWMIYGQHKSTRIKDEKVLSLAKKASRMAIKLMPESGSIYDTLAHLVYSVDHDLDNAIKLQKMAVKYAGPHKAPIQQFMDVLLDEQKASLEKDESETESN